jgi:hypothetical protein
VDVDELRIVCLRLAGEAYEPYAEGAAVDVDWPIAVHLDAVALAAAPGNHA